MKKVIAATALVFGMMSAQSVANDGPNPCQWEHFPQPGYCKSEGKKPETRKNKVESVTRKQDYSKRYRGGDR